MEREFVIKERDIKWLAIAALSFCKMPTDGVNIAAASDGVKRQLEAFESSYRKAKEK